MRGVFVTGTGTGVGKTYLSAALAAASLQQGVPTKVRKPLLSGLDDPTGDGPPHDHVLLSNVTGESPEAIAPLRFGPPVSPHLAAAQAGVAIDPGELVASLHEAGRGCDRLIVEGAGGWRVPIDGSFGFRELAVELDLPVVVAAPPVLGTINHCLLTLESIRASGLEPRCVVFGPWPATPDGLQQDAIGTVAELGSVEVSTLPAIDHRSVPEFAAAGALLPLEPIFD